MNALYADDIALVNWNEVISRVMIPIQAHLKFLQRWYSEWRFEINGSKSVSIFSSNKNNLQLSTGVWSSIVDYPCPNKFKTVRSKLAESIFDWSYSTTIEECQTKPNFQSLSQNPTDMRSLFEAVCSPRFIRIEQVFMRTLRGELQIPSFVRKSWRDSTSL